MAVKRRTDRLNSLLKEVLSEVIRNEVKNPDIENAILTITSVDITKDLRHAKVFVSVIGDEMAKKVVIKALKTSSGFISVTASKMVTMHHFPALDFRLDDTVEKQMQIHDAIEKVQKEREQRNAPQKEEGLE